MYIVKMYYNIEKDDNVILFSVRSGDTFLDRFKGLMMKKGLGQTGGLYLTPCNQIHTFMMRFRIDVIFLSLEHEVLYIESNMKPCRVTPCVSGAVGVLETAPGFAGRAGIRAGDKLDFVKRG